MSILEQTIKIKGKNENWKKLDDVTFNRLMN